MKDLRPLSKLPNWIDALWLGLLSLYILAGAAIVPFHGDESTQIFMGRDFYYIFVDSDYSRVFYDPSWSTSRVEQHLRLVNGTISKTIHGWLAAKNGIEPNEINSDWDWQRDYIENRLSNRIPANRTSTPSKVGLGIAIVSRCGVVLCRSPHHDQSSRWRFWRADCLPCIRRCW